ncbi:MAG: glycosyltransferase [Candidatus Buchananbacteria bacterium]
MKIALVHDHLAQDGGAERVLKIIQQTFVGAPTYTLFYNPQKADPFFAKQDIRTSWLQQMPGITKHYQWYLTLMPAAVESLKFEEYDVVLSDTSSFAKGIITGPQTLHLCYCHTPTRYIWSDRHTYVKELHYNRLVKLAIPAVLSRLRQWDFMAAQRPDKFLANSALVQKRIAKYYHRPSQIIHPPVETNNFKIAPKVGNYFLIGGRLVAYKRYDLAVKAFSRIGLPLKIFGEGPELANLQKLAKKNIEFLGKVDYQQLTKLYSECLAFLHPQEEDFGITAVEAMAAGRPVIAYAAGGALETVIPGVSGQFIDEQSWEAIIDAVIRFKPENLNPLAIKNQAEKFSVANFQQQLLQVVNDGWQEFRN